MNSLVITLNNVLNEYQEDLHIKFEDSFKFKADLKHNLYFAGQLLCNFKGFVLISHVISVNYIIFHFDNNRFIRLDMIWPEDKDPYINAYTFGYIQNDYDFDEIKEALEEIK